MADSFADQMAEVLTIYSEDVNEKLREITKASMKKLVKETKATAPRGKREGEYKKHITADYTGTRKSARGLRGQKVSSTWYVKAPEYRLTHLLIKGHATVDGDRTEANPFLQNAIDKVIPEYEQLVREAIENGN